MTSITSLVVLLLPSLSPPGPLAVSTAVQRAGDFLFGLRNALALIVSGSKVHTETREVIVPPEKRVLNVEVLADAKEYLPGTVGVLLRLGQFLVERVHRVLQ